MTTSPEEPKQESSSASISGLPLTARKKMPIKFYGLFALLAFIVIVNHFFLRTNDINQKPDEAIDSYSLKPLNPIANEDKSSPQKTTLLSLNQDKMKQQLAEIKAKDFVERLQATQAIEAGSASNSGTVSNNTGSIQAQVGQQGNAGAPSSDVNTAFLESTSQVRPDRSFAQRFRPQPYLIGQGKFIFATLSVAINSDLSGQVSAIVNQDVYGEQGRKVLIPRGSRLVGEYRSGLATNQSRLFVVWTRVIQPNGISVMIGSEGSDALGQAGMTGAVDYHFFARFGTASLISLIGAGASTVGVNPDDEYNSMAAYRQAVAQSMSQQASSMLSQTANIPPTVHVRQGERVVVFVNKDLDFSKVLR
jgi:type IV secretion system protein VirB10